MDKRAKLEKRVNTSYKVPTGHSTLRWSPPLHLSLANLPAAVAPRSVLALKIKQAFWPGELGQPIGLLHVLPVLPQTLSSVSPIGDTNLLPEPNA